MMITALLLKLLGATVVYEVRLIKASAKNVPGTKLFRGSYREARKHWNNSWTKLKPGYTLRLQAVVLFDEVSEDPVQEQQDDRQVDIESYIRNPPLVGMARGTGTVTHECNRAGPLEVNDDGSTTETCSICGKAQASA